MNGYELILSIIAIVYFGQIILELIKKENNGKVES